MKSLIVLLLLVVLVVPVIAYDPPINEAAPVYPIETQLPRDPITEQSFVLKEESKGEIIEVAPITIEVTPFLSSGSLLSRTVEAKELPLNQVVTSMVKQSNRGIITNKIIQMYPQAVVELSDDAQTIKQTTEGDMKLELYYDYQKLVSEPWSKYYKVEKCVDGICRVVTADFATRTVQVREITLAQANSISGIPEYGVLP